MRVRLPGGGPGGLSRLLQRSIVVGAALAMLLFALPLAFAVVGLYRAEAYTELASDAEKARGVLTDTLLARGPAAVEQRLARIRTHDKDHDVNLGVYRADGTRYSGSGPLRAEPAVGGVASTKDEVEAMIGDDVLVAVPVNSDDSGPVYVVRSAESAVEIRNRTLATWALMTGLGGLVLAVVGALARARARRIARPLQQLAREADSLGRGVFSVRAVRSGVAEVDVVSTSLERTARRLGGMLERERSFSADASHQLRTPLTAVRLGLESALITPGADLHQAVEQALTGLDRLEQTVLDLLALARDTTGTQATTDVVEVVAQAAGQWATTLRDAGRPLSWGAEPGLPPVASSAPALRTVLDVLLGNALVHGGGRVHLSAAAAEDTVVIQVSDEGAGVTADPQNIFARRSPEARGTGIGLALARSLVEADGGRLELTRAVPATFTLLLPATTDHEAPAGLDGAEDDEQRRDEGGAARAPDWARRLEAAGADGQAPADVLRSGGS